MDNSLPLVSIIIPVYNRERFIEKALESAVNQTYTNIEIIVVDNKSTDNTWHILQDWIKKDNRIKVFQNERNLGPVLNWQECIKKSSGEFIKILWSDDWIDYDFLDKSLPLIDDDTAFVISNIKIIKDNSILYYFKYKKQIFSKKEYLDDIILYGKHAFPVSPGCALFRKKDIINSFILSVPNGDNLDSMKNGAGNDLLLFLTTTINYSKIRISDTTSYFRYHDDSLTVSNNLMLYYEWSKIYFIEQNHLLAYEAIYKVKYWKLYYINKKKAYKNLYASLNFHYRDVFQIIQFIFKKIYYKSFK